MICALCRINEANKKNTHFLTDGIIRSCLNLGGSNEREAGYYFNLSNNNPFVDFNFQRKTSVDKIEESLGRKVSEEEIQKAKATPFSVDNIFCRECENIFTEIENKFIANILPKFRNADLSNITFLRLTGSKVVRLFSYLQIWRSSVCSNTLKLSDGINEKLRMIILNHNTLSHEQINHFPLSITYLQTIGGKYEYTKNLVGLTNDTNPSIIFLNDFIIQFFDDVSSIKYLSFYGLNDKEEFKRWINVNETSFDVKIFSDKKRKELLKGVITPLKILPLINTYMSLFITYYKAIFRENPSPALLEEYSQTIFGNDKFSVLKYSRKNIAQKTYDFIVQIMQQGASFRLK